MYFKNKFLIVNFNSYYIYIYIYTSALLTNYMLQLSYHIQNLQRVYRVFKKYFSLFLQYSYFLFWLCYQHTNFDGVKYKTLCSFDWKTVYYAVPNSIYDTPDTSLITKRKKILNSPRK